MKLKRCCVPNCTQTNKNKIKMHQFPTNFTYKKLWCKKIFNVTGHNIAPNLYVCEKHFEKSCYYHNKLNQGHKLKANAIPTLYCRTTTPDSTTCDVDRVHQKKSNNTNTKKSSITMDVDCISTQDPMNNNIEQPFPFRFEQTSSSSDGKMSLCNTENLLPPMCSTILVDSNCDEKVLLLNELQTLRLELKKTNRKYNLLKNSYEQKLKELKTAQDEFKNKSKAQNSIKHIESDAKKSYPLATFILDQIHNYSRIKPCWSEHTIHICIAWRCASPKGYDFITRSNFLKAPSRYTLSRYMGNIRGNIDLPKLIQPRLLAKANNTNKIETVCLLEVDDMAVKEKSDDSQTEDTF